MVKVFNAKGEIRRDAAGAVSLMHPVDAMNAEKTGKYRLVRELRQFGDTRRNVVSECHEKNADDFAKDLQLKRAALEAQKKDLEKSEVDLQGKLEDLSKEVEEAPSEPKNVSPEAGTPLVSETKKKK